MLDGFMSYLALPATLQDLHGARVLFWGSLHRLGGFRMVLGILGFRVWGLTLVRGLTFRAEGFRVGLEASGM